MVTRLELIKGTKESINKLDIVTVICWKVLDRVNADSLFRGYGGCFERH
jgi:hypothetical protein